MLYDNEYIQIIVYNIYTHNDKKKAKIDSMPLLCIKNNKNKNKNCKDTIGIRNNSRLNHDKLE